MEIRRAAMGGGVCDGPSLAVPMMAAGSWNGNDQCATNPHGQSAVAGLLLVPLSALEKAWLSWHDL
jgi:hypothetical protein